MPRSKSPVVKKYIVSKPATVAPAPSSVYHHHNVEVERPGFFSNMWQGFGLGAGQAIGHNIFRSDTQVKVVHEQAATTAVQSSSVATSVALPKDYTQCLKDNNNDKDLCKQFLG